MKWEESIIMIQEEFMAVDFTRLNKISEMYSGMGAPMGYNPNEQLTTNFKLSEFVTSTTAQEKGIDNTPTPEIIENLRFLAGLIQSIRDFSGPIQITSGYRSQALQDALIAGGNKNAVDYSAHTYGLAADITPAAGNTYGLKPLYAAIVTDPDYLKYFGAVVLLEEKGIMHVEAPLEGKELGLAMYEGSDGQYYRFKSEEEMQNFLSDVYDSASAIIKNNPIKTFMLFGGLTGAGILGYFLWKRRKAIPK